MTHQVYACIWNEIVMRFWKSYLQSIVHGVFVSSRRFIQISWNCNDNVWFDCIFLHLVFKGIIIPRAKLITLANLQSTIQINILKDNSPMKSVTEQCKSNSNALMWPNDVDCPTTMRYKSHHEIQKSLYIIFHETPNHQQKYLDQN